MIYVPLIQFHYVVRNVEIRRKQSGQRYCGWKLELEEYLLFTVSICYRSPCQRCTKGKKRKKFCQKYPNVSSRWSFWIILERALIFPGMVRTENVSRWISSFFFTETSHLYRAIQLWKINPLGTMKPCRRSKGNSTNSSATWRELISFYLLWNIFHCSVYCQLSIVFYSK